MSSCGVVSATDVRATPAFSPSSSTDEPLGLAVRPLAVVLVADVARSVDEVLGGPVVVGVGAPRREGVVERDRVANAEPVHRRADVVGHVLERELGAMDADDREPRLPVGAIPRFEVRERAEAVDARVRPEVDEHDPSAQLGQ